VKDDLSSHNSVTASKKSRVDLSQCLDGNVVITECDADKSSSVSVSGHSDLTGNECSSNRDNHSGSGFDSSCVVSESDGFSPGQPQCCSSSTKAVSNSTVEVVDVSQKVEDCWWNQVDSQTWLQGLQSYLLLHSTVDAELHQVPVTVPNVTPFSVVANPTDRHHPSTLPRAAASGDAERNSLCAPPVLAPVTGYRVSPNGVLTAVPIYYFPVVNYSTCKPTVAALSVGAQQTDADGRQSTMAAAVDLVSFMHNYCLPPSSLPQSSAVVQTTHSAADQRLVSSQVALANKAPLIRKQTLMNSGAVNAESHEQPSSAVPESSHSGSWPTMSVSSNSDVMRFLSNSSVCLTPRSLSSCSSAESCNDEASELTSCFSTVAVTAEQSDVNIDNCNLLSVHSHLTVPGWFGKGLGNRRLKRRLSR